MKLINDQLYQPISVLLSARRIIFFFLQLLLYVCVYKYHPFRLEIRLWLKEIPDEWLNWEKSKSLHWLNLNFNLIGNGIRAIYPINDYIIPLSETIDNRDHSHWIEQGHNTTEFPRPICKSMIKAIITNRLTILTALQ